MNVLSSLKMPAAVGSMLATIVLTASVAARAIGADPVYLEEPRPEPPPKEVRKVTLPEKYEDGTLRVEREVIQMSDNTVVNDGTFTEYYHDGQKFAEGTFAKGVHNGEWTFWHPNGQVCKTVVFNDGLPNGEWDVFGPDGKKQAHKVYANGKRQGQWIIYHKDGETPRIEQTYVDGQLDGARNMYHMNGKIFQRADYKNGKLDGKVVEWDASGRKVAEVEFKDGVRQGGVLTDIGEQ
ncbi:MAG: hypothetical protein CMJ58_15745 [Planctomycetaceae bacterium]|nr:hypothetical protein [Planctomycetaceae bacterium]